MMSVQAALHNQEKWGERGHPICPGGGGGCLEGVEKGSNLMDSWLHDP